MAPEYQRLLDKSGVRAKLLDVFRFLPLCLRNLKRCHVATGAAVTFASACVLSSCTDSGSGMSNAGMIAEVKPVSSEMLKDSRLRMQKVDPAFSWVFREETFWIERREAAPLPTTLVEAILGQGASTPWMRGKWALSADSSTLTLTEITGPGELAADVATIPVGLAALMQITLAGDQYVVEEGGAAGAPSFDSGQPVAFRDREVNPVRWGFRSPATGEVLIPAIYEMAWDFSEQGVACVWDEEPYIINSRGERLVQPYWIDNGPDAFCEGLARYVGDRSQMGFFNAAGEIVIPARWTFVEPFSNGLALVNQGGKWRSEGDGDPLEITGGLWGAINDLGQEVLKVDFAHLERGAANTFRTSPDEPWFRPGSMLGE